MTEQLTEKPGRRPGRPPPPATPRAAAPPPVRRSSRGKIIPLIILVLAVAAFFIWRGFFASPPVPPELVILSGRIEGDDSAVAAKVTGRLLEVRVREGDTVKAGDTIAVLDDEQMRARMDQAQAALAGAEARVKTGARSDRGLPAAAGPEQSGRRAVEGGCRAGCVRPRPAWRRRNRIWRNRKLAETGAVRQRCVSEAGENRRCFGAPGAPGAATADQHAAAVAAARRRLEAARGNLTMAQASLSNAGIHEFQSATVRKQIASSRARSRAPRQRLPRPVSSFRKRRRTATI